MFERKDPFNWKAPALILLGVVVLSGGIYLGVKTRDTGNKTANAEKKIEKTVEKENKEVFQLSKDCEVWVHKKSTDGSDSDTAPIMIGTIDKALLNKSETEIRDYLKEKYPERHVESLSKYEIILSEVQSKGDADTKVDPAKFNKYTLETEDEFIVLYKYDKEGKKELVEKTDISIGALPKKVQDEIKKGIILNSEDEAYTRLEEFGS